jgi:hypothetical protein
MNLHWLAALALFSLAWPHVRAEWALAVETKSGEQVEGILKVATHERIYLQPRGGNANERIGLPFDRIESIALADPGSANQLPLERWSHLLPLLPLSTPSTWDILLLCLKATEAQAEWELLYEWTEKVLPWVPMSNERHFKLLRAQALFHLKLFTRLEAALGDLLLEWPLSQVPHDLAQLKAELARKAGCSKEAEFWERLPHLLILHQP